MTISHYTDIEKAAVFITGGGSGIGASFVKAFAAQGCRVAFVDIDDSQSSQLCEDVEALSGTRPLFQHCDVSNIADLQQAIARANAEFGGIGVLINNAASDRRFELQAISPKDWDQSMNINLRPHFFSSQAVAPIMQGQKHGSIINIGSNSALLGLTGYPAYVAAKSGIIGLTKALARELGADNIRVNSLIPGWVMTDRQQRDQVTPEALQECLDQQCLKSTISEEDVSNSALFLASRASGMITGQCLIIDGGRV